MSYNRTQPLMCKKVGFEDAKAFLLLNDFPGQRVLNPAKVSLYANLMREKKMRPVDIDIAAAPGGKKYLMNGQHVCAAIMATQQPYDARIQYWKCLADEDLWHLFGTFDVHAARTEAQILKAAKPFLGKLSIVPAKILQACASALAMIRTNPPNFGATVLMKTQKIDLLLPNSNIVFWVASLNTACQEDRRPIMRTPAIAAMISTYKKNPEKADKFWMSVCTGHMVARGSCECRLGNILLNGGLEKNILGGGQRNRKFYIMCVLYWNSWINGEQRKLIKSAAFKTIPPILS